MATREGDGHEAEGPTAEMLALARQAMARAYAPYSHFPVGAVLLGGNGRLYAGCNVENAAYPQGCCAEASAISAMVMDGERRIAAALVMGEGPATIAPCGGCRQRLREFGADAVPIYLCGPEGLRRRTTLGELLPLAFGPENLTAAGDKP
jgi:cytidine deaminase